MIPLLSAPSWTLSHTFYDSPSYCSETDKNNLLFCVSEGVPSEEVQRVRGVRQTPEEQEGSTVSHSRGVSRLDACVPSRTANLQLRLFLTGASELMAGMGGRRLVSVILLELLISK